jgi:hypothetical protein
MTFWGETSRWTSPRLAPFSSRASCAAVHVFHHEAELPLLREDVEDGYDVGMPDAAREARFVEKLRDELRILRELGVEALDRHRAGESEGAEHAPDVDRRHPARRDLVVDGVSPPGVRRRRARPRLRRLPLPEENDAIAQGEDVLHPVRSVDARARPPAERAKPAEEALPLVGDEERGRLVEGEDARIVREGPDELDHLLLRERQLKDERGGGDLGIDPEAFEEGARARLETRAIDEPVTTRFAPEHQVLRHGEVRDEDRLRVDHRDPGPPRVGRGLQALLDPVDQDAAPIARVHPGEDADEGGLPRPAVAAHADDLPPLRRQIGAPKGTDRTEVSFDPDELEEGGVVQGNICNS